jgi:hypothetical protein
VKFRSSRWFGRVLAQFPTANAGSREVKSTTDGARKLGAWKPSPSVVQVFVKPHSLVTCEDYKLKGRGWKTLERPSLEPLSMQAPGRRLRLS